MTPCVGEAPERTSTRVRDAHASRVRGSPRGIGRGDTPGAAGRTALGKHRDPLGKGQGHAHGDHAQKRRTSRTCPRRASPQAGCVRPVAAPRISATAGGPAAGPMGDTREPCCSRSAVAPHTCPTATGHQTAHYMYSPMPCLHTPCTPRSGSAAAGAALEPGRWRPKSCPQRARETELQPSMYASCLLPAVWQANLAKSCLQASSFRPMSSVAVLCYGTFDVA